VAACHADKLFETPLALLWSERVFFLSMGELIDNNFNAKAFPARTAWSAPVLHSLGGADGASGGAKAGDTEGAKTQFLDYDQNAPS